MAEVGKSYNGSNLIEAKNHEMLSPLILIMSYQLAKSRWREKPLRFRSQRDLGIKLRAGA